MQNSAAESPLERICRQAREHDEEILANHEAHDPETVALAQLATYQRERLSIASTLRYDD